MPHNSTIRAVVFDAVGTVMYPQPSVAEAYQRALQKHCSVSVALDTISSVVRKTLAERSAVDDLSTNEEAEHQFWADLIRELCPNANGFDACYSDLFEHFGQPASWCCFPDVAETMSALANRGVRIGIASNFDRRLHPVCDGLSELSSVTVRIISSVVGWRKPAPQFFEAVSSEFELPREQILMVGDDLTNDVSGALSVGMPAVLINRSHTPASLPAGATSIRSLNQLPDIISNSPTVDLPIERAE